MSPPTATTAPCLSSQCSEGTPRGGRSRSKSSIMGQKGRSWRIKCAPALRQSQKHFLCATNKCLWHLYAVQAPLTTFTAGQTLPEEPPSLATAEASLSRVLGRQNDGNYIFPSRRKAALPRLPWSSEVSQPSRSTLGLLGFPVRVPISASCTMSRSQQRPYELRSLRYPSYLYQTLLNAYHELDSGEMKLS